MDNRKHGSLVLPLIDENKPKCYLCHEQFENMDELIKQHQQQRQMDLNVTNSPLQNQEDKKQINDLKEEVTSLKSTIEIIQDQMNELRKEIVYSNVNNTIENMKKTVEFNLSA